MSGLSLRARPGEWFLALLCACQILPIAIHRTSFKGSASERPVRHQSTSEWSGCTNQFSQDRQTLETAGTLLIAFVAQTSVVEHCFTPKDKKSCYNHTLRVVRALCLVAAALALSSAS